MIVLQCSNITKSFGVETILDQVKLEVKSGERVALVGRNGAGKSTLLKIIAGTLSYDRGDIVMPKEATYGYLEQHSGLDSDRTIWEEMLTVFEKVRQMEKDLRTLEEKMADPHVYEDTKRYEKVLAEYDSMQHTFKERGGYKYEADIRSVLAGLHFGDFDYNTPVSTLSGGQKTRLALGKLLLSKPDLLILDEPTNHLDLATLSWLEQYLQGYSGAILIVSHDRYFLDKLVHKVYEISRTKSRMFHGNYSNYLEEKARIYEQELKAFEKQQAEISRLEDFVQKNIVRASTSKRAQSRRKKLEKIERLDHPEGDLKSAKFSFDIEKQSGNDVLIADNLSFAYNNEDPLFKNLNLKLQRGESVALIGPNGAGKSTLLKMLSKHIQPKGGQVKFGSKVTVGYYDQEQANLHSHKDVLHELWDDYPLVPEKEIRTVLGNFLFSGEDVLKLVSDLSGGEKARLALAKLMMQKANLLIFDEPTNHLDLDSKEVLENALIDYPGTLLFVSHDRYFLNRMASRILELQDGDIQEYLGDYDYYLMKKEEDKERQLLKEKEQKQEKAPVLESNISSDKQAFFQDKEAKREERRRLRQIEKLEEEIEQLEEKIAHLEEEMLKPEVYEDHEKAHDIQTQIEMSRNTMDEYMEQWEGLQLEGS